VHHYLRTQPPRLVVGIPSEPILSFIKIGIPKVDVVKLHVLCPFNRFFHGIWIERNQQRGGTTSRFQISRFGINTTALSFCGLTLRLQCGVAWWEYPD
jgi:hypothetical protein